MTSRIVILTKEPRPGSVKTRLIPSVGAHAAARLHESMVWETIRRATRSGLPTRVALDGALDSHFAEKIRDLGLPVDAQANGDLGDRLSHAMHGSERTIALGTDCVVFDPEWLLAAASSKSVSIGPADDGGYWMIGVTPAPPSILQTLFAEIPWSTSSVCEETVARLRQNHQEVHWLPTSYDVDTMADLVRLRNDPACPDAILPVINASLPIPR